MSKTTAPAESTGAFDKVTTNITWGDLPASVTKGEAFTVTVYADGKKATITQSKKTDTDNDNKDADKTDGQ